LSGSRVIAVAGIIVFLNEINGDGDILQRTSGGDETVC